MENVQAGIICPSATEETKAEQNNYLKITHLNTRILFFP